MRSFLCSMAVESVFGSPIPNPSVHIGATQLVCSRRSILNIDKSRVILDKVEYLDRQRHGGEHRRVGSTSSSDNNFSDLGTKVVDYISNNIENS